MSVQRKKRSTSRKKFKKTDLLLAFEHDQLLGLKKVLFENGLTAHQFFGFLIEQLVMGNDERLESFLREAQDYKKKRILDGKEERVEPATLYKLIEEELNKH